MITFSLETLAAITGGELIGENVRISEVTTDTRKVTAGSLFIALSGERFDAHDFIDQAAGQGAAALLVSRPLSTDIPQVRVSDTRIALGQIAAWVRQHASARVVALTGSSGKTSVKEMTAAILRQCGETLYTAGNLNNDIGVPLTLLRLTPQHQYAVIELGANHQGEIAYTTALTSPEAALINNLAAAHLEGFGSLAGVAKAKGEIFAGLPEKGIAIVNLQSHDLSGWQPQLADKTLWRFTAEGNENSEFYTSDLQMTAQGSRFTLHTPRGAIAITLPLPGRHNIANALAAAALALAVDAPLDAIQAGLSQLQAVAGRLFPVVLTPGQLILDDSYNANVGSMTAAVNVLADMPGYRVFVVGDMAELGEQSVQCHRDVGQAARDAGIDKVLSVGTLSRDISETSGVGEHFSEKTALTERLRNLLSEHAAMTILIKGSRSAAMEQVVQSLQEKGTC